MTDRELMQMAFDVLDVYREHDAKGEGFADQVYEMLRNRLVQPEYEFECPRCGHCCQQREWVGFTDEEAWEMLKQMSLGASTEDVRFIEAKLKEKNTWQSSIQPT